ncbi:tumor necrosis factor receptor superfamily member wengen isoform X1 [Vespula squamosa]|uniref:Tumor necrosis factor receptor superfamily member wengen isoform X1 n=1 Tax=Vespula squamosa TaxID=30214 RepID=A0ABD1ZZF8_VESSQ
MRIHVGRKVGTRCRKEMADKTLRDAVRERKKEGEINEDRVARTNRHTKDRPNPDAVCCTKCGCVEIIEYFGISCLGEIVRRETGSGDRSCAKSYFGIPGVKTLHIACLCIVTKRDFMPHMNLECKLVAPSLFPEMHRSAYERNGGHLRRSRVDRPDSTSISCVQLGAVMPKESCCGLLVTLVPLFVGVCDLAGAISGSQYPVCKPGLEFWSTERASCWPCTRCAPKFTLSPCAVHQDAICGPLSALELDWSFLSTRKRPENGQRRLEAVTSKMLWRFPDLDQQQQKQSQEQQHQQELRQETRSLVDATYDDEINVGDVEEFSSQEQKRPYDPRERRKSNIEGSLSWDWQTAALVLAVCACVVFFLVAGCSALVYARQWRRMKKNFEPVGLEEISARLNVMVKAELAELVAGAPMSPGDPETRCQYLEKLLAYAPGIFQEIVGVVCSTRKIDETIAKLWLDAMAFGNLLHRKRETPVMAGWPEVGGNLYIEEGETPRSKRSQIARIHRNIETILSHKTNN